MTTIELRTIINAPIALVFDQSRNIDFHMESASQTKEEAIGGVTSGLIKHGETVTWRGKHFGVFLKHTSKIIEFERPYAFTDIMVDGHFTYFGHQHYFKHENGMTFMTDVLKYKTPYGPFGRLFNFFLLKSHLTKFLESRNQAIKECCEMGSK